MSRKKKNNKRDISAEELNKSPMEPDSSYGIPDPLNYSQPENPDEIENYRTDQEIINETHERIRQWYDYHQENILNLQKNRIFVFIKQWDDTEEGELRLARKPILQSNKIYDSFMKMSGEYREIGGELRPISINHKATEDEMTLAGDYLRTIYSNSSSQLAYFQAFDDVLIGGFGCYGVGTMYESPDSSHQIPYFYDIKEPDKCVFDLNAKKTNKQDGRFCLRFMTYTKKAFKERWPDIPYPSSFPTYNNPISFTWGNGDIITVVELYEKEDYDFDLHTLSDGREVRDEEWKEIEKENKRNDQSGILSKLQFLVGANIPQTPKITIVETHKRKDCKIKLRRLIASQVIEENIFPGNQLPIVFVPGPSTVISGVEHFTAIPTFARDPQRLHNYIMVEIGHSLQINRKERFLATKSNIGPYKKIWENPLDVQGALMYEPDTVTQAPPIQLNTYEIPQTLLALYPMIEQSIKTTVGFFDSNVGNNQGDKSGVLFAREQMAGALSTSVAKKNMDLAIGQGGQILMGMRKDLFQKERNMILMGSNNKMRSVRINRPVANGQLENNLSKGDYNVVFESGPTQQMQKENQMEVMIKLAQLTQQPALVADLIAEMADGLPALVERFRTLVPPEIIAKEDGKPPPPPQPNPQMMMFQKQMELKEKEIQLEQQKLQVEVMDLQAKLKKLESDTQISQIKAQAEVGKANLESHSGMVDATAKIIASNNDLRREVHKHLAARESNHEKK